MYCDLVAGCEGVGVMRLCGHVACDSHTDEATDTCLFCTPVDEHDYALLVQVAALGRVVGYAKAITD